MTNLEVLNEVSKGAQMGMDSIKMVMEKSNDKKLKSTLDNQFKEYKKTYENVNKMLYENHSCPKDIPPMQKAMTWMGIQTNTLMDKSNSQLSSMMIQGINMGIIEGVKLLNNNPEMKTENKEIIQKFIKFQEKNIDDLKEFL